MAGRIKCKCGEILDQGDMVPNVDLDFCAKCDPERVKVWKESEANKVPVPMVSGTETGRVDGSQENPVGLSLLGNKKTVYPEQYDPSVLETFPNRYPHRDYTVTHTFSEFTALCPITRQPDFAEVKIEYVPDQKCLESKSLKIYMFSFRNHGGFCEDNTNLILEDLIACLDPRELKVTITYTPRGADTIGTESYYNRQTAELEALLNAEES